MKKNAVIIILAVLFPLIANVQAADKVVVIPLSGQSAQVSGQEISSLPHTISSPGFYYLSANLSYGGTSNAITINADGVTLDFNGYGISSTNQGGVTSGIYMNGRKHVEVRNGRISDFSFGIFEDDTSGIGHHITKMKFLGNYAAVHLSGTNHLVTNCIASENGSDGIYVEEGIISDSTAQGGSNRGFDMVNGIIKNSYAVSCRIGFQLISGALIGNVAMNNVHYGFLLGSSPAYPVIMDQNSASGNGTNYFGGTPTLGTNAGI